jgi:predicted transcriptional regulator
MKTRVIQTSIWRDILDEPMNIDTKLLYMYLLTNEHIGQTDYLKVIESEVSFYTGLDQKQIKFCLKQLEDVGLIRIYSNWVMFTNGAYIQSYYKGKKNEKAQIKPKSTEKSYSEFNNVKLTDEDLNKLYEKIGKQNTDSLIEELGGYIAGHGKKYKSHYAVLQNWAKRRAVEAQAKKKVAFIDTSI